MNSRQSSEFAADPITTKPVSKAGLPDPVSPPYYAEATSNSNCFGANGAPLLISEGFARESHSQNAFNMGLKTLGSGGSSSSYQALADTYNMSPGSASPSLASVGGDWQQHNQYQQLLSQQALLNQLQSKMQLGQGPNTSPQHSLHQQSPLSQHSSLLSQQLHTPSMQDPLFNSMDASRVAYPHPAVPISWPGVHHPRSPPTGFAGSPSAAATILPDHQGLKHSLSPHDDRKHSRAHLHGNSCIKGRPVDIDSQGSTIDKLRREIARLQSEVDRLEKEVARQKSLRETERIEFTDAKDRVRHSWAVDRDDFARVKSLLKTKNAEHHAQSGRLSQQLKEVEAVNRGLKEICARHGLTVPPELEVTHSRRHSLSPGQRSSMSMPSLPSSQISGSTLSEAQSMGDAAMVSRTPSETSFDSDFLERLAAARVSVRDPALSVPHSASQPPSPVSPATAVLQMMQQLQEVLPANSEVSRLNKVSASPHNPEDSASEPLPNDAATQAAAQAAAALSQLAAALSAAKLPFDNLHSSRSSSPHGGYSPGRSSFDKHSDDQTEGLGQFALTDTNLNRMSLQSWVKPSNRPSQSPSDSSRSCSPRRTSGDGSFMERKPQAEQGRLTSSEGAQFSLNAQSTGNNTLLSAEEIQMWPPSPSQQGRSVETLHKPSSLSACGSPSQQEGTWLARQSEGRLDN